MVNQSTSEDQMALAGAPSQLSAEKQTEIVEQTFKKDINDIRKQENCKSKLQPLPKNLKTLIYLMRYMKVRINVQIINTFFKKTDGRDKSNKSIEYFLKFLLWKFPLVANKDSSNSGDQLWKHRAKNMVNAFSITRKATRLAHCLETYASIENNWTDLKEAYGNYFKKQEKSKINLNSQLSEEKDKQKDGNLMENGVEKNSENRTEFAFALMAFSSSLLEFWNDVFDDVYFLAKIKVIDSKWEPVGSKYGCNLWFITIIADFLCAMYEASKTFKKINTLRAQIANKQQDKQENELKELKKLENQCTDYLVNSSKFFCDFIFCLPDIFIENETRWAELAGKFQLLQILSGLSAALFSWIKYMKRSQPVNK